MIASMLIDVSKRARSFDYCFEKGLDRTRACFFLVDASICSLAWSLTPGIQFREGALKCRCEAHRFEDVALREQVTAGR